MMTTNSTALRFTKNERIFLGTIFVSIFVFIAADLVTDFGEGVPFKHLVIELGIAFVSSLGFFVSIRNSFKKDRAVAHWKNESKKYIEGLSAAIDAQLIRWKLTHSEKEVALLLKGLSTKEISDIRQTSEKTVRAQAVCVYEKSGLSGRSELAAYFLEDLLQPIHDPSSQTY